MSARRARVLAPYATVKLLDPATGKWTVRGFHRDAVFPESADPDNVAALVRREYAEWVDDAVAEAADAAAEEPAEVETELVEAVEVPAEAPKPARRSRATEA